MLSIDFASAAMSRGVGRQLGRGCFFMDQYTWLLRVGYRMLCWMPMYLPAGHIISVNTKPYFVPWTAISYSTVLGSFLARWASRSAGSAYKFQLLFGTNPDMAYPFFAFWVGLGLGSMGWIVRRPSSASLGVIYIVFCAVFAFVFLSFAVLYQPWISRFLGPTYIPLIPVAAVGIGLLLEPIQLSSALRRGFSTQ